MSLIESGRGANLPSPPPPIAYRQTIEHDISEASLPERQSDRDFDTGRTPLQIYPARLERSYTGTPANRDTENVREREDGKLGALNRKRQKFERDIESEERTGLEVAQRKRVKGTVKKRRSEEHTRHNGIRGGGQDTIYPVNVGPGLPRSAQPSQRQRMPSSLKITQNSIKSTISRDNTLGEPARHASLLAHYGQRIQPRPRRDMSSQLRYLQKGSLASIHPVSGPDHPVSSGNPQGDEPNKNGSMKTDNLGMNFNLMDDDLQTGDVLGDFDFDSFLRDNDGNNEPFGFGGAFPTGMEGNEIGDE